MSAPRWRELRSGRGGDPELGARKKAPPADGIKMKKAGATWWGKRWLAALEEVLGGQAGRLARGRSYARAGRVHDLTIEEGAVEARVTGTAASPYRVSLALAELADETWKEAVAVMAAKAQFAAALLSGEMPEDVDAVFRAAGGSLFPRERTEVTTRCSCPDAVDPCKHVAATHYVLGEALDRDPFLLFELRGRTRAEVLGELRRARAGSGSRMQTRDLAHFASEAVVVTEVTGATGATEAKVARTTTAERVTATNAAMTGAATTGAAATGAAATSTAMSGEDLHVFAAADYDRAPEPLPKLEFSFEAHASTGSVLRQLGAPPGWSEASEPADAFAPLIRRAAEAARRAALAEKRVAAPPATAAAGSAGETKATATATTTAAAAATAATAATMAARNTPPTRRKAHGPR